MSSNKELIDFVDWICNRLRFKYKETIDTDTVNKFDKIKSILGSKNINIRLSQDQLDNILCKYYADFYMDSCDNVNIGYTDTQRDSIRQSIMSISKEILEASLATRDNETSTSIT